jgi:OOP family OmpA-OmpF porin
MIRVLVITWLACFAVSNAFAQSYTLSGSEVIPEGSITFATGKATINSSSEPDLMAIKKYLDDKSYISTLRVEGHVTGAANSQQLSEARAIAVCAWLVDHGIDCKRLLPVGFGDTKPIAAPGEGSNTRITFVNAALRGRAIGGMPTDGGGLVAGDPCK